MDGRPSTRLAGTRLHRSAAGAVLVLFWALVAVLVGARVVLFDEIGARPSDATVSAGAGGRG